MKNGVGIYSFFLARLLLTLATSCNKDDGKVPVVITKPTTYIGSITNDSVSTGGTIAFNGGSPITDRGICFYDICDAGMCFRGQPPTVNGPKISYGGGADPFVTILPIPHSPPYRWGIVVRAYATNSKGTGYGEVFVEMEKPALKLTTSPLTEITPTTAISGGNVISDHGLMVSERGVCWSTGPMPTINDFKTSDGTGTGAFTSNITGLTPNTAYRSRAYATNSEGTAYGDTITFKTLSQLQPGESVADIEGNVYPTVIIGSQLWMAENLRATTYNDGSAIPLVEDDDTWLNLTTTAYCWYNNDAKMYKDSYGALYNWYTVDSQKLCPSGWHVPNDDEWTKMTTYLGGDGVAGGKLKEAGTSHWLSPNVGATNETGFTALPGGFRNKTFDFMRQTGGWWCSSEVSPYRTANFNLNAQDGIAGRDYSYYYKGFGLSVRCLKD